MIAAVTYQAFNCFQAYLEVDFSILVKVHFL
jgi:hypothetical protein